jgi:probable rRNA maturation factor
MIINIIDRRSASAASAGGVNIKKQAGSLRELGSRIGKKDWLLNLVLVDDKEMVELNGTYRGKNGVTDVLSFSYLMTAEGGKPDLKQGQCYAPANLMLDPMTSEGDEEEEGSVGELILAPAFIAERCLSQGWDLKNEMALLVVHGCLHVLGWDHEDDFAREVMQVTEEGILADSGYPHPMRSPGETN